MRYRMSGWVGQGFVPEITRPVDHESVLELAGREWFVLHTPGHTGDHICLHDPENGVFLSGDHVLPSITPHISGLTSAPDPLKLFFYSLDRVGEIRGVKIALPAHGHPFTDLRGRTEAIKRHHHERLDRVRAISRDLGRPASVEEFSEGLFAARSRGPMADSETYAHLEHLRHLGQAERRREKGKLLYEVG
jgi:glyoxylase-like metal-dependent hydrolase (beta-lactamase superfamily II)